MQRIADGIGELSALAEKNADEARRKAAVDNTKPVAKHVIDLTWIAIRTRYHSIKVGGNAGARDGAARVLGPVVSVDKGDSADIVRSPARETVPVTRVGGCISGVRRT